MNADSKLFMLQSKVISQAGLKAVRMANFCAAAKNGEKTEHTSVQRIFLYI